MRLGQHVTCWHFCGNWRKREKKLCVAEAKEDAPFTARFSWGLFWKRSCERLTSISFLPRRGPTPVAFSIFYLFISTVARFPHIDEEVKIKLARLFPPRPLLCWRTFTFRFLWSRPNCKIIRRRVSWWRISQSLRYVPLSVFSLTKLVFISSPNRQNGQLCRGLRSFNWRPVFRNLFRRDDRQGSVTFMLLEMTLLCVHLFTSFYIFVLFIYADRRVLLLSSNGS